MRLSDKLAVYFFTLWPFVGLYLLIRQVEFSLITYIVDRKPFVIRLDLDLAMPLFLIWFGVSMLIFYLKENFGRDKSK